MSVTQHLTFHVIIRVKNDNNLNSQWRMKVESFKRFSLETLRCRARAFPVGTATRLVGHFKIYSAHMRMWSMWLRPFCSHLGETFFVSTEVCVLELLAVSMPPSMPAVYRC